MILGKTIQHWDIWSCMLLGPP